MTLAPRIETYTQLSCHLTHHLDQKSFYYLIFADNVFERMEEDLRRLPSAYCLSNPAVQAGAARLQTLMTITMGFLSALTTGWWGTFSERHGRTMVLAISTFGLLMTDLIFILVSTPSSPLSSHGHKLLLLAPIIEGLLGGWSTLQSVTFAYLSDCTSSGSRSFIFSRFSGVFYIGLSIGPTIGGYLIKHPIWTHSEDSIPTVTSVFWVAIFCSFLNFILVLFVFPESLGKSSRLRAEAQHRTKADIKGKRKAAAADVGGSQYEGDRAVEQGSVVRKFLRPLRMFQPAVVHDKGVKKRRDWNLTILGAALFGYMLSMGVHQIKYLYAGHVYGWGAGQLSYYISFIGGARAVFLLFLLPWIITTFKPKPRSHLTNPQKLPAAVGSTTPDKKPKPTRDLLAQGISFDLVVTYVSLVIDLFSYIFVVMAPMPFYAAHTNEGAPHYSKAQSQVLFVAASSLNSMASGTLPAIQSLALSIVQVRARDARERSVTGTGVIDEEKGVGEVFGALAVLQTVGQMILGPVLFGLVYGGTVATFPKAVFVMAGGIIMCSLVLVMLVRAPLMPNASGPVIIKGYGKGKRKARDGDRGRSQVRKDLRGGAIGYGSMGGSSRER